MRRPNNAHENGAEQLQLPHLARPQGAEPLRGNCGSRKSVRERNERRVDRFIGELERAVMMGQRGLAPQSTSACTASDGFMC